MQNKIAYTAKQAVIVMLVHVYHATLPSKGDQRQHDTSPFSMHLHCHLWRCCVGTVPCQSSFRWQSGCSLNIHIGGPQCTGVVSVKQLSSQDLPMRTFQAFLRLIKLWPFCLTKAYDQLFSLWHYS